MKLPRFAIENVLLHLFEHFTYLNRGEDKGVRIIEGLLYSVEGGGGGEDIIVEPPIKDTHSEKGTINISTKDAFNVPKVPPRRGQLPY